MVCEGVSAPSFYFLSLSECLPLALTEKKKKVLVTVDEQEVLFPTAFCSFTSRSFVPRGVSLADLWGLGEGSCVYDLTALEEDDSIT